MDYLRENGIDVDSSIEILGDMEMVEELLSDFLVEMDDRIPLMKEYLNNKDMENYAIVVHSIKSDSKYLGFNVLADMALEHQLKSQDNDVNFVEKNFDKLLKEINRILEVISKYKKM